MLEASMKETATGVVDLSSQYSLEAFREFMAFIYYNKLHTGSYVPLLFEILCIAEHYDVEGYKTYIKDHILGLVTSVPICLSIAAEARKHGTITTEIYNRCLKFLVSAMKQKPHRCFDNSSGDAKAWCCASHSKKSKGTPTSSDEYTLENKVACIYSTISKTASIWGSVVGMYTQRCCMHGLKVIVPALVRADQLPEFIMDDINQLRSNLRVEQRAK